MKVAEYRYSYNMDTDETCGDLTKKKSDDILMAEAINSPDEIQKTPKITSKKLMHLTRQEAEERRLKNNENERIRTHAQVDALYRLAKALPPDMMARKKWSKQFILSSAINYIRYLDTLINHEGLQENIGLSQWKDNSCDFLQKLQQVKSEMGEEWDIRHKLEDSISSVLSNDTADSNNNINDATKCKTTQDELQHQSNYVYQINPHPTALRSFLNVNHDSDTQNENNSIHNQYISKNHFDFVTGNDTNIKRNIPQLPSFKSTANVEGHSKRLIIGEKDDNKHPAIPRCYEMNKQLMTHSDHKDFHKLYQTQQSVFPSCQKDCPGHSHQIKTHTQLPYEDKQQHRHYEHIYHQFNPGEFPSNPQHHTPTLLPYGSSEVSNGQHCSSTRDNFNTNCSFNYSHLDKTANRRYLLGNCQLLGGVATGAHPIQNKPGTNDAHSFLEDSGYMSSPTPDQFSFHHRHQSSLNTTPSATHFLDEFSGTKSHPSRQNSLSYTETPIISNKIDETELYNEQNRPTSPPFSPQNFPNSRKRKYTTALADVSQRPVRSLNSFFEPDSSFIPDGGKRRGPVEFDPSAKQFIIPKHSSTPMGRSKSFLNDRIFEGSPALSTSKRTATNHFRAENTTNNKSDTEIEELFNLMQGSPRESYSVEASSADVTTCSSPREVNGATASILQLSLDHLNKVPI